MHVCRKAMPFFTIRMKNFIKEDVSISAIGAVLTALISLGFFVFKYPEYSTFVLKWGLFIFSIPLWYEILRDITRRKFGVDLIAGVALFATFFFGAYLPGIIVLIMLSGGETLEAFAMRRARRELSALLAHEPLVAHVKTATGLVDISVKEVAVDSTLLVKPGEIIPVDGVVIEGNSSVDESAMTGESIPEEKWPGSQVISGTRNTSAVIYVRTTRAANESRFEQILKLVKEAEESRAPLVRLADKYSVYFTIVTFVIAGIAYYFTHDTMRVLAVLVVATPCPLILATPIAIISGISRSARAGVIIKNGGALEILAQAKTFIFDKTGTVTLGIPQVERVDTFVDGVNDVLVRSASLDQCSTHILARALVVYTNSNSIKLSYPDKCVEHFGEGIEGELDGVMYRFGSIRYLERSGAIASDAVRVHHEDSQNLGMISVYLSRGNEIIGAVLFADKIRADASKFFENLRTNGIKHVMLLTGDKKAVAEKIGKELGISEIQSECMPEDKVKTVNSIAKANRPVVMVGDGVNDAPALAVSDVGIALGTGGETASSDAAHIVIVSGSLERVGIAHSIAIRTLLVAKQGIFLGIGLSVVAMIFGAVGLLPPLQGAILQEGIDVLVILNALRVAKN